MLLNELGGNFDFRIIINAQPNNQPGQLCVEPKHHGDLLSAFD
jgi:hypothetical protein